MYSLLAGLSLLGHEQLSSVASKICTRALELVGAVPGMKPLLDLLKACIDAFTAVFARSDKSPLTVMIRNADTFRDGLYESLKYQALSYSTRSTHPDQMEAGQKLVNIIEEINWTLERSDSKETEQIERLIVRLGSEDAKNAITLCGLEPWVEDLGVANEHFKTLHSQRTNEKSTDDSPDLKKTRKNLENALRGVISFVETMNNAMPDQFHAIFSFIDESIKEELVIARAQVTRELNVAKKQKASEAVSVS